MISTSDPNFLNISYLGAGRHRKDVRTQCMAGYTLLLVDAGEIHLETEDGRLTLHAGDVLFLRPETTFSIQKAEQEASMYWVCFTKDPELDVPFLTPFQLPDYYPILSSMQEILNVMPRCTESTAMLDLLTGITLLKLYYAMEVQNTDPADLIYRVRTWIQSHHGVGLSVSLTAKYFHYHPDYLCAQFRRKWGVSLKQFIDMERLEYAKYLLRSTNQPIKSLAAHMGWENENRFVHFFKYREKISPTQYRMRYFLEPDL